MFYLLGGGGESLLLLSKQLHLAIILKFTRFFFNEINDILQNVRKV